MAASDQQGPAQRCSQCDATDAKLQTCARCHVAMYCCRACQKLHWPTHKAVCDPQLSEWMAKTCDEVKLVTLEGGDGWQYVGKATPEQAQLCETGQRTKANHRTHYIEYHVWLVHGIEFIQRMRYRKP